MRQIILTKEQATDLKGVIIPNGIDGIDYTIKDGGKIELYTETKATVVVDVLDGTVEDDKVKLVLVKQDDSKVEIK